jgi:phosphatidylserine/phosphatidylglycerophosphate/cardiolipin synthase-like enzyme
MIRAFAIAFFLLLLLSAPAEARRHKRTLVDEAEDSIAASLVKSPEDQEVCFSPEERCDLKLLKFVDSAKTSLEIAIYDINLGKLVEHIIQKSKQIPVRMVVDRNQAKGGHSAVPKLIEAGVSLRFGTQRGSGIMHNKFVVVDGRMMETGSFNQTSHAAFFNNENQIYLTNSKVVDRYKKRFEQIWERGKSPR